MRAVALAKIWSLQSPHPLPQNYNGYPFAGSMQGYPHCSKTRRLGIGGTREPSRLG
jgi:hypothetical protein